MEDTGFKLLYYSHNEKIVAFVHTNTGYFVLFVFLSLLINEHLRLQVLKRLLYTDFVHFFKVTFSNCAKAFFFFFSAYITNVTLLGGTL